MKVITDNYTRARRFQAGNFVCDHCKSVIEVTGGDVRVNKISIETRSTEFTWNCPLCREMNWVTQNYYADYPS